MKPPQTERLSQLMRVIGQQLLDLQRADDVGHAVGGAAQVDLEVVAGQIRLDLRHLRDHVVYGLLQRELACLHRSLDGLHRVLYSFCALGRETDGNRRSVSVLGA